MLNRLPDSIFDMPHLITISELFGLPQKPQIDAPEGYQTGIPLGDDSVIIWEAPGMLWDLGSYVLSKRFCR